MAAPVMTVVNTSKVIDLTKPSPPYATPRYIIEATISYDTGNYVTGGVPIAASDFGLTSITGVEMLGSSIHNAEYDHVAGKMVLRVKTTHAEVGSGAALTASNSLKVRVSGF